MRIPITGFGALTPFGLGVEPLWAGMVEGRCAIDPLPAPLDLLAPGFGGQVTARWPELRPLPGARGHRPATMTRYAYLGCGAIGSALEDAGIDLERGGRERGLYVGSYCNMDVMAKYIKLAHAVAHRSSFHGEAHRIDDRRVAAGMKKFTGFEFLKLMNNMPTAHGGIQAGAMGPCNTYLGFAAAGLQAIGRAGRAIEDGLARVMIAGGVGASVADQILMTRGYRGLLCSSDAAPAAACRPFDRGATGIVPGEGGGFLVLGEPEGTVEGHEPRILGELVGFATAFSPPVAHPGLPADGEMAVVAARRAMDEAGADPDLVVLTGWSSTPLDELEAAVHARVLGDRAASTPALTLGPFIGSTEAASGPLGAAVALRAMAEGVVPAWPNLTDPIAAWTGPADGAGRPGGPLRHALVLTLSPEGSHAAVMLRGTR